jgi:hypothetical protein
VVAWHRAKGKAVKVHQRSQMRKCMHDDIRPGGCRVPSYHTVGREAVAVDGHNPSISNVT